MAVCNTFKTLSKETGTFLTFSQYMEDLTIWQTESKYHKVIPSKFVAIDCKSEPHPILTNYNLPRFFQERFENACACFKNHSEDGWEWSPKFSKILFWDSLFQIIDIDDVKYVGDINLQSYNHVDGMGYSEIYCHIPNEACEYKYNMIVEDLEKIYQINRNSGDYIEGFRAGESNNWGKLTNNYEYKLDKNYIFSWEDPELITTEIQSKSFNINMIVVLYDVEVDDKVIYKDIPLGVYITGLVDNYEIQNSIVKYVSNEDIYNTGTSYGLRICSRYVASDVENNYVVKDVTIEDNNYGDLSRVLSQLSISQTKMDEVVNKTYNTEQNYKNLLAIFKNSRVNVPYIKVINNESYWFVNGKMIGPSITDGVFDAYSKDEMDDLLGMNKPQTFQIRAKAVDENNNYIFKKNTTNLPTIILSWEAYYEGKKVRPTILKVDGEDYSDSSQLKFINVKDTTSYQITARYNGMEASTTVSVYFVDSSYFGEVLCDKHYSELYNHSDWGWLTPDTIKQLPSYVFNNPEQMFNFSTNQDNKDNPGHICYAYPKQDGNELSYIFDNDGYVYYDKTNTDNVNAFIKLETLIDDVEYYVYINTEPSYQFNQIMKFKK